MLSSTILLLWWNWNMPGIQKALYWGPGFKGPFNRPILWSSSEGSFLMPAGELRLICGRKLGSINPPKGSEKPQSMFDVSTWTSYIVNWYIAMYWYNQSVFDVSTWTPYIVNWYIGTTTRCSVALLMMVIIVMDVHNAHAQCTMHNAHCTCAGSNW